MIASVYRLRHPAVPRTPPALVLGRYFCTRCDVFLRDEAVRHSRAGTYHMRDVGSGSVACGFLRVSDGAA